MELNNIKYELQHILQGKSPVSQGELIQAIATYLRESTETSAMAQRDEPNKKEETKKLVQYINANNLWNCDVNFGLFISQGAEQRVFIHSTNKFIPISKT